MYDRLVGHKIYFGILLTWFKKKRLHLKVKTNHVTSRWTVLSKLHYRLKSNVKHALGKLSGVAK